MAIEVKEAEIDRSALIIVDMQNDFLHPDGGFAHLAREHPEANIDMPFLRGTIPHVSRLAEAFRSAGRPVVYIAHVVKPDYSDAAFPYWRIGVGPSSGNRTFIVENTWERRSLTSSSLGNASIWSSRKALAVSRQARPLIRFCAIRASIPVS
jgi:isochorismate hydrolase